MIEEILRFAGLSENPAKWPKTILDVGCGLGGSSTFLAKKFGATSVGITISPVQAERATAIAAAQGLADKVSFQVGDAVDLPFPDGKFDLVWCLECAEHISNKAKFVAELARVAAPGGTVIIVGGFPRDHAPGEERLKPWEEKLLKKISDTYFLPENCSASGYCKLLESVSLQDIKSAEWTQNILPFWPALHRSTMTWKGLLSLFRNGLWRNLKLAFSAPMMEDAYKKGLLRYSIIASRKPE